MSSELALSIEQVSKSYQLYDSPQDRLKQMLFRGKRQYFREYQALSPLSFSLPKGEVLGIVGRNGAGKSTLLQLICGTLTPTSGNVTVNGRIAALLELGAGFNPQFTGRENIYLSASIMGVPKQEIEHKVEAIIDFAGVRNFIDQPVSTYSSGMYVRLAFSVATSIEPDILIIDEALSVGDGDFARRSFERIMAMKERGATILFCSHSLYQIEVLCSKAIWLEKGRLIKVGEPVKLVADYQAFLDRLSHQPDSTPEDVLEPRDTVVEDKPTLEEPPKGEYARIKKVLASTPQEQGERLAIESCVTDLTLDIQFVSTLKNETPQIAIAIHNAAGQLITSCAAWTTGVKPSVDRNGNGQVQLHLPKLPLLKGTYYVGVLLFCQRGLFLHDEADPVVTLDVTQTNQERGLVMLPHSWQVTTAQPRIAETATVKHGALSDRWQTRPARAEDFAQLQRVYQDAFQQQLNESIWNWKYRHTDSAGFVVTEGDEIVAFCGGAPRQGLVQGRPSTFCQIGDVMVQTSHRGVLSKTGPFYRCVLPFMADTIGQGRAYEFAFGFPNYRHLRVGERHKLYAKFDKIVEATWPATPAESDALTMAVWDGSVEQGKSIDQLWLNMSQHMGAYLVGLKDQSWMRYRFLEKPDDQYQLHFIGLNDWQSSHRAPIGLIVTKDHPEADHIELLDFVCEPQHAAQVINAAQQLATQLHRAKVYAWLTPNVSQWLTQTYPVLVETDVVVPGNGLDNPEHTQVAVGNWWLMGGDSDFR
ncbi:GNAT family N-acetyltransferase [Marinomonas fungiae]|uniref:GNAT family N-acetyltransferase n=1 Tax=Marinomonas fungiae TaxID=1137284 RepID=UPI003A8F4B77